MIAYPPKHRATAVDLTALPGGVRAEVITGEIVARAPSTTKRISMLKGP